ncbi:MAG: type II toxin-antitoxin system RelE/ParE family toxin [Thermomicrobiales bacterium]
MSGGHDLRFAARARADYKRILAKSAKSWGVEQQVRLSDEFDRVFVKLLENPGMGKSLEETSKGLRSFYVSHHLIYYRIRPGYIRIVRILHERQFFRS